MNNSHFPKLMTTARAVLGELIMIWGERFDRGAKHPAARRGRLNQMIIERDIIYTPIDWPETLRADLYRPKDPERQAAVLLIHGGGWSTPDSRALMRPIAKRLAGRGYVVMNASYRLAPQYQHPAPIEDLQRAVSWLCNNSEKLQIDPNRIAAYGYSAGGHLAALLGTLRASLDLKLSAVVAGGAPTDLAKWPEGNIVGRYLGGHFDQIPERFAAASPINHVHRDVPPMFLYHGTHDKLVPVDHATDFKAILDQAGVVNELLLLPGCNHLTAFLNREAVERAIDFLDQIMPARRQPWDGQHREDGDF